MFATLMYRLTGVVLVIMITTIHAVVTIVNAAPLTLFESFADMVMVFAVATVLFATQDSLDHDDDAGDYVLLSTAAPTMCSANTPTLLDLTKPQVSSSDSIVSISERLSFETFSDESCSAVSLSDDDEEVEADSFSFSSDDDDDDSLLLSPEPSSPPSPRPVFTRYGRQVKRPIRFMFDAEPKSPSSSRSSSPPSPSMVAKNLFPSPVTPPPNSSAVSAQAPPPQPLPPVPAIAKPINRVRFVEGIETEPPLLKPTGSILRRSSYGESPVDFGLVVMHCRLLGKEVLQCRAYECHAIGRFVHSGQSLLEVEDVQRPGQVNASARLSRLGYLAQQL